MRAVIQRWLAAVLLAVGLVGGGACTASTPSTPRGAASTSPTSPVPVTVSASATRSASATPSTTSPTAASRSPGSPAPSGTRPAPLSPRAVVLAYFQAINDHDYATAWRLGGKNLGQTYRTFVHGFADTEHDTVTVTDVNGDTVTVGLVASHTDGSTHHYTGTYTVTAGTITSADVHEVAGTPGRPSAPRCGAPANPYGYNFCGGGRLIHSPPTDFCSYFTCIDSFEDGRGYVVQCTDGEFSRSGGRPGACSSHEGVRRPLHDAP